MIKPGKDKKKAGQKGFKNKDGDYVVTTIDIPDMRTGVKSKDEDDKEAEDESDSDDEYDEEEDKE